MRILAVDDDQSIRDLVPMILAGADYDDVTVAGSADEALQLIEAQDVPFDCLMLDVQMPGMDGIDLCRVIRKMPEYARSPIIMLTAQRDRAAIDGSFAAGATDYVTKPPEILELCTRVRLAELLVEGQRRGRAVLQSDHGDADYARLDTDDRIADAIEISGVTGFVPAFAFTNYLAQLSRARLSVSNFFCVRLNQIEHVHALCTPPEFQHALTQVAAAIAEVMRGRGFVMTYAGNGNFICNARGAEPRPSVELEREIQFLIDEKDLCLDTGAPLDIEIGVGAPLQPSGSAGLDPETLIRQTITSAVTRIIEKRSTPTRPNIRHVNV